MTLRHLSIFTVVADTLSMTLASKKLFISQPTVSQAIRELERDLGINLFERLGGRLYLTDNGQQFLSYARHVTSLMSEAVDKFSGQGAKGKLRVASTVTVGTTVFNSILVQYKRENPDCDITFRSENTSIVENLILSDQIDIAIVEGTIRSPHIITIPIMEDELVLIASPNSPLLMKKSIKSKDLEGRDFILREEGSGTKEIFVKMMDQKDIRYSVVGEMNNAEAIKMAVSAGLGMSVISRLAISRELKRKELCLLKIDDLRFLRKFCIVYHKNKFITQYMQNFIRLSESLLSDNITSVRK